MYRRIVLVVLGAAVLASLGGAWAARSDEDREAHHGAFQKCARACTDCTLACESCFRHCVGLATGGHKEHARTLQTCNDCGDFCALAARIVSRRGPTAATTCEACAKVCDTCGQACEKFPDDEHMVACARACRDCARECREMMKHSETEEGAGGR